MVKINKFQCELMNTAGIPAVWLVNSCRIDLSGSDLHDSKFDNTNLGGSTFRNTSLFRADMLGSKMVRAKMPLEERNKIAWVSKKAFLKELKGKQGR